MGAAVFVAGVVKLGAECINVRAGFAPDLSFGGGA